VAAVERRRQRRRGRRGGCALGAAHLGDERAGLLGRGDLELAREELAQVRVGRQRGRPVARGRQVANQVAVGVLGERVGRDQLAGARHGRAQIAGRLGSGGEPAQRLADGVPAAIALVVDPLVGQPREELAAHERECVVEALLGDELVERTGVDPHIRCEADLVARGDEVAVAERAPQVGERGAQARAGALVEDLGPEPPGHLPPCVHARVQRQPAEQRAQAASGRGRQRLAVELERQLSEDPDPQH
jgi:hypothetical protein